MKTQKTLQIANDVELATLVVSGALDGVASRGAAVPQLPPDGRAYSQGPLLLRRDYPLPAATSAPRATC